MKTKITRLALLLAIGSLMPVAYAQEKTTKEKETKTTVVEEKVVVGPEKGSIAAALGDSATFSILTKALQVTGLDATLGSHKGTFTIFAPTDEAFSKLPAGTLDKLMLPENNEKLRSLLLFHVLPGSFAMADLKNGEIKTMNGEKVEIDIKSDTKQVEDSKIFKSDVVATNGIIHSVDKVMVPHSLDGFAKLDEK
ncbi:fasciclin domain-containing protein [Luteolibacter soli]|uniref:Fasciclin domain-containing protein n=1 Tax=Luteolibacter soli TaxID=3135280 RepID=A0ABU9AT51_9BACT